MGKNNRRGAAEQTMAERLRDFFPSTHFDQNDVRLLAAAAREARMAGKDRSRTGARVKENDYRP